LAWQICKTNPKLNYVRGTGESVRSPAKKELLSEIFTLAKQKQKNYE